MIPVANSSFSYKRFLGKLIRKINDLKLPIVADNNISNIKILNLYIRIRDLFEENFMILDIVLKSFTKIVPFRFVFLAKSK
jgi:hypothetical protein